MKNKQVWNFDYKGFSCEIQHWGVGGNYKPEGIWCGYIYVMRKQIPDNFKHLLVKSVKTTFKSVPKRWEYEKLENFFNLHCGITYYEVIRDEFDVKRIRVKEIVTTSNQRKRAKRLAI